MACCLNSFLLYPVSNFYTKLWFSIKNCKRLNFMETLLRSIFILIWIFLFCWIWVGVNWAFNDIGCKDCKIQIAANGIWSVSMAILIFWVIITSIVVIGLCLRMLKVLNFFEGCECKNKLAIWIADTWGLLVIIAVMVT